MIFVVTMLVGGAIADFVRDIFSDIIYPHVPLSEKDIISNAIKKAQDIVNQKDTTVRQEPNMDTIKKPFLLLGMFIRWGKINCIYSKEGIGKTFLSIQIAKESPFLRVLIFALDDLGEGQLERYDAVPSIAYITRKRFDEIKDAIKEFVAKHCQIAATINHVSTKIPFLKDIKEIEVRTQKLMKKYGVADPQKIDDLFVFETLAESQLCMDADIVVLDSLNALIPIYDITRENIKKIISLFQARKQTLIILHHTNKEGKIAGPSFLPQEMETNLELEDIGGNYRKITISKDRFGKPGDAKECWVEMISEGDHSVRFEVCEAPSPDNNTEHLTPLEREIVQEMEGKDSMKINDLFHALKKRREGLNPGAIKNSLKSLEEKEYVEKGGNGKTWDVIINHRKNDTF